MNPEEFDSLTDKLKKLPGEFKLLVEKRIELFVLEAGERIAGLITGAIYRVTGVLFMAVGLILILFAASKLVGDLVGSEGLGFVLVSLPILIIGAMFFRQRPRFLIKRSRNSMLNHFMEDLRKQMAPSQDDEDAGPEKPAGGSVTTTDRQAGPSQRS